MATGLFPIRSGKGGPRRGYVPKNRRKAAVDRSNERQQMVSHFAECLAESGDVALCARRLGKSPSGGGGGARRDPTRTRPAGGLMATVTEQRELSPEDEDVRLECVRLAMAFGTGDPVATAEKLFRYIKEGPEE